MANYIETIAQSACNRLKRSIPYGWDLNIYRGCEHGCKYCYARYSHQYLNDNDYFNHIYVKTNIVEQLEKQLSHPDWKRQIINIGGVTDSYQPAEEQYKLMPDILNLLIRYKTPAIISTKSDLILRDYDRIDELSRITYINVAATVTTTDETLRTRIEPGGVSTPRRFRMLKEFRKTNASIGLHVMPIIPYLTDSAENFDSMFAQARECGADYVLPGTLYLRGNTKQFFLDFIKQEFPHLYPAMLHMYPKGSADKTYKENLYRTVNALRDKYNLSSSYSRPMKEKLKNTAGQ